MAKKSRITNSTVNPGKQRDLKLEYWYGPMQHVGNGISSDPEKAHIEPGTLRTAQYKEDEVKVKK